MRGTFNGDFIGASGTTASVDGVAEVHGTAGEGAPFTHSSWIWGGMAHYGLGYMKGESIWNNVWSMSQKNNKAVYTSRSRVRVGRSGEKAKKAKWDQQTDGRTDLQTDRVGHRVACTRLKTKFIRKLA